MGGYYNNICIKVTIIINSLCINDFLLTLSLFTIKVKALPHHSLANERSRLGRYVYTGLSGSSSNNNNNMTNNNSLLVHNSNYSTVIESVIQIAVYQTQNNYSSTESLLKNNELVILHKSNDLIELWELLRFFF